MQLNTAKQEALAIIQRLPDTADMEEIMYRLYVLENIRRGQKDAEQGKSMPTEQVLRDIQTW
jgi:predicted transcriptional regulator